ncbi:MAG: hypothetical protein NVS3B8_10330 [Chitinophagaceae bacterium]
MLLRHEPVAEAAAGKPLIIAAKVVGVDTGSVLLQVSRLGGGPPKMIYMVSVNGADYQATIPADLLTPGLLNYRIILQKGDDYVVFPGGTKGDPFSWDNYYNETWKTYVTDENGRIEIFNPTNDRNARTYPAFRRNFQASYITGELSGQLILRLAASELSGDHIMAVQQYFADKLKGRSLENDPAEMLMIRARTGENRPLQAKVTLTNADAVSMSAFITLTSQFTDIEVPLNNLVADSALLMPRPYPGFLPLKFKAAGPATAFRLPDIEKIEISIGSDLLPADLNKPYSMELTSVWFQKSK